ncbi:MAG: peptidylprolyl isomerase [Patescibacteria group bacterium]|nr:peptidylprolyl isomerase [Patescibacteria group bacterium]
MKNFYKSFLVAGLAAFILLLSACTTQTPNVNDNMDIQDEEAVVNTVAKNNVKTPEKKPELGEFSADTNPGAASTEIEGSQVDLSSSKVQAPDYQPDLLSKYSGAVIKTNQGDITVKFYKEDSPVTVNNFLYLAQAGFYNGSKFHRVIKDFMIQGGDPNSKDDDWSNDGFGGPGYYFKDEINTHKLVAGSLAMANSGAGTGTNGSQFFIVTADATPWLDGAHTNFGEVVSGMDVVRKIEAAAVNDNDHPTADMVILSIELLK